MATSSTASVSSSRRTGGSWRSVAYCCLGLMLCSATALVWLSAVARSALPQLDGQLKLSGLSRAVIVSRDTHGIPTINADRLEDLFFAQGYITASDRLF